MRGRIKKMVHQCLISEVLSYNIFRSEYTLPIVRYRVAKKKKNKNWKKNLCYTIENYNTHQIKKMKKRGL